MCLTTSTGEKVCARRPNIDSSSGRHGGTVRWLWEEKVKDLEERSGELGAETGAHTHSDTHICSGVSLSPSHHPPRISGCNWYMGSAVSLHLTLVRVWVLRSTYLDSSSCPLYGLTRHFPMRDGQRWMNWRKKNEKKEGASFHNSTKGLMCYQSNFQHISDKKPQPPHILCRPPQHPPPPSPPLWHCSLASASFLN